MREVTQFANYHLEIWRRPRQRNMHLTVRPDGRVRVTCNKRCAKREILAFVEDSRLFIEKRTLELEAMRKRFPPKQMLSGETFLFFGRALPLQVVWTWSERCAVTINDSGLEMTAPLSSTREARAKAMRLFYKKQARLHLAERVKLFSEKMNLFPKQVSVRGQITRWGSCSARGEISLNMKLMCAPEAVIDYVVIHELAHIQHLNHSPRFWNLVGQHFPGYGEAKAWLKSNQAEIAVQFDRR
ncbi:MAG: M48 family metallopeptidase [Bdellovibrionales bacterium]|nr:M48 family metallopeptidase [Bdellovibrionales bacterium]